MMMAKVLPTSVAISSRMKGNFCTVETMIFFPSSINLRRSPERSAVTHGRADLHELLDGGLDLIVEQTPVGHHDDRVEHLLVLAFQTDELVREPGDGVRLAASRRMLDQVALARAVGAHVGQRLPHHTKLVVA